MGFLLRRSWALPEPDGDLEDYGPDDWQIPDQSDTPVRLAQKGFIATLGPGYSPGFAPMSGPIGESTNSRIGVCFAVGSSGQFRITGPDGGFVAVIARVQGSSITVQLRIQRPEDSTPSGPTQGINLDYTSPTGWAVFAIVVESGSMTNLRYVTPSGGNNLMSNSRVVNLSGGTWSASGDVGYVNVFNPDIAPADSPWFRPFPGAYAEMTTSNSYWDVWTPSRVSLAGGQWRKPPHAKAIRVWTVDQDGTVRQVTKPLPARTSIVFASNGQTHFGGERGSMLTDRNAVRVGNSQLDMTGIGRSVICRYIF